MGTFQEFSRRNRVRCEAPTGFRHPLGQWSASDWMTALVGEVGEAANIIKKLNRLRDGIQNKKGETEDQLHAMLRGELADAFTYLDLTAQALGFDILEAAERKFEEVSAEIGYDSVRPFSADKPRSHDWVKSPNDLVMWVCDRCKLALSGYQSGKPDPYAMPHCVAVIGQVDPPVVPVKGDRWVNIAKEEEWEFDGERWVQVPLSRSRFQKSLSAQIADDMAAGTATFGQSGPAAAEIRSGDPTQGVA